MSYRVLIVHRRVLFAAGLARLLATRPEVTQAQTLLQRSSLTAVLRDAWDVVVVDVASVAEVLGAARSGTRVLLLLESEDAGLAATMISQGVSGICTPEDGAQDLAEAVELVATGAMRLPPHLVGRVLSLLMEAGERIDSASRALARLTPRELDVLRLLGDGLGRAEIARATGLSQNTVRTHIQHLLGKLSMHSQLEAAAYAREVLPPGSAAGSPLTRGDRGNVLLLDPRDGTDARTSRRV